jgi:predicted secreted hydrolase
MRRLSFLLGIALLQLALLACGRRTAASGREPYTLTQVLAGPAAGGFERALFPRPFRFPADHGSHPGFRSEWWYFTGNVATGGGRPFGFQLTLFRFALAPPDPAGAPRPSAWGATQAWLAHLAVSDLAGGRIHAAERWARQAQGLAGARSEPLHIWLRDWSAESIAALAPGGFPLRLRAEEAADEGFGLDLTLAAGKPIVLQGDRGLSQKSAEPGNASYYYSLTRMPAQGEIRIGGARFRVAGLAWMDREWSTSALAPDQLGWDWFALQLADGRELMLYRLRRRDGRVDPASRGTLVERDGRARPMPLAAASVESLGSWTSPASGVVYPAGWRIRIPGEGLDLRVRPALAAQELNLSFRYWEGAVVIDGTSAARNSIAGRGYVELTGYDRRTP